MERQPEGVQVVEGVGLVASGSQFFSRLAAVFADEAGRFIFGIIQLCVAILGLRIIGVAISYFKI